MDSSNDLRLNHDISEDAESIKIALRMQSPPLTKLQSVGYTTMGLDCLLVVIRRLYSFRFRRYSSRTPQNLAAENKNPILQMAWQDFSKDDAQEWSELKRQILERFKPAEAYSQEIWFENLCLSPLMLKTFWSRPEHHLYRALLVKSGSVSSRLEWDEEELVKESTMVVDQNASPDLDFQEHIDQHFGWRKLDDGTEALFMCKRPLVLRIKYSRDESLEPFPFSDIKNIRIPIAKLDDSAYIPVAGRALYTLLAVVFLAKPGQRDCVRTYEFMGSELVLSPSGPFYADMYWSLETPESGTAMLFYGLSKEDVTPHPGYGECASRSTQNIDDSAINGAI